MNIEHNSQELFYRSPFGALKCDEELTLRIALTNPGIPHYVKCIYGADGEDKSGLDMCYVFSVNNSNIYQASMRMPSVPALLWYYFEIKTDDGVFYYANNKEGLGAVGEMYTTLPNSLFQVTVYDKCYTTPDWFKKSIAYQIFPDRFYNGNDDGAFLGNRNDIIKRKWNDTPFYKTEQFGNEYKCNDFFGGNLSGIIKKLHYLKELGISVIYLNPIFKAYSNHKYDTGSYEEIDEMFGDEETFSSLCNEAEKMGIKIILDGVFNHTGSDSMYFNKNGTYNSVGAYQSQASPYYSWYKFNRWPEEYESWWGIKTLPHVE
ncbi:MAG: glycoside hydrolase family 13 protein, partial [Clostridia bacterium]|nr:glycoside hydrolase family 13 protein [Clostridia bacterium]